MNGVWVTLPPSSAHASLHGFSSLFGVGLVVWDPSRPNLGTLFKAAPLPRGGHHVL